MGAKTIISWTNFTFNIAWGCTKVSPGCKNCYADGLANRYGHDVWGPNKPRRVFGPKHWAEPTKWNRDAEAAGVRHRVFCSSMCDVFEDHPTIEAERAKLWALIRETPWLDWQLLSKRPERIAANLPNDWGAGYANVWMGTSIESNEYVSRADHLRSIPASVRFISYEPALGPLDQLDLAGIDQVIYGGESGPGWRPEDKQWARDMYARCQLAGVAFYHKQSAGYRTELGVELDGKIVHNYPVRRLPVLGSDNLPAPRRTTLWA
jgi:protein gp37